MVNWGVVGTCRQTWIYLRICMGICRYGHVHRDEAGIFGSILGVDG